MRLYLTSLISQLINSEPDAITYAYIFEMIDIFLEDTEKVKEDVKGILKDGQKENFNLELEYTTQNLKDIGVADLMQPIPVDYEKYKSKKIDQLVDKQFNKFTREIKGQLMNLINAEDVSSVQNLLETYLKKEKSSQSIVNKMMRIYRTEDTYMRSLVKLDIQKELLEQGIKVKRRWVHTLRVAVNEISSNYVPRDDHLALDGVLEDSGGYFHTLLGDAKAPCMFGIPEEDINCRCDVDFVLDE